MTNPHLIRSCNHISCSLEYFRHISAATVVAVRPFRGYKKFISTNRYFISQVAAEKFLSMKMSSAIQDFDKKYDIIDEVTPINTILSGHYKQSFAYYTLKDRLPVIITRIIDTLSKDKEELLVQLGEDAREEIKNIVGLLSKLKYQLQTDKQFENFTANEPDKVLWNNFLKNLPEEYNTFFKACWLYSECYTYRKVSSFFENTKSLANYDYFSKQKKNALEISTDVIIAVVKATRKMEHNGYNFIQVLKLNLWGNRCDLSISSGNEVRPDSGSPFDVVKSFEKKLVIDESSDVWSCLDQNTTDCCINKNCCQIVDIICDNAGYEFFTDLILAEYIIDNNLADKVRFYVKAIPWFISDVTKNDFEWTLNYLCSHDSKILKEVGKKWTKFVHDSTFEMTNVEHFWTSPYEFYRMIEVNRELYKKLSEAKLIVFKGDLNYRKLISDFNWDTTESFKTCLKGFQPSNLCTLRTIKADLICGLKPRQAEQLYNDSKDWMISGEYGLIQFSAKKEESA